MSATDSRKAKCPLCLSAIDAGDEAVRCRACGIAHHRECWLWNGRCTTYGCDGSPLPYDVSTEALSPTDTSGGVTIDIPASQVREPQSSAWLAYEAASRRHRRRSRPVYTRLADWLVAATLSHTWPADWGYGSAILHRRRVTARRRVAGLAFVALCAALGVLIGLAIFAAIPQRSARTVTVIRVTPTLSPTPAPSIHVRMVTRDQYLRSASQPNALPVYRVSAGALVGVLQTKGKWAMVITESGNVGWVARDALGTVKIESASAG